MAIKSREWSSNDYFGHSWALMDIRVFMAADAQMT